MTAREPDLKPASFRAVRNSRALSGIRLDEHRPAARHNDRFAS